MPNPAEPSQRKRADQFLRLSRGLAQAWHSSSERGGRFYSVPLSTTLGVPFYFDSEASSPFILTLLDAGQSPGATLAFLITSAGTSIGAIIGALTIARWRVVGVVVATRLHPDHPIRLARVTR